MCYVCVSACALVYLCVHVCVRTLMRQIYKGSDAQQNAYILGIDLRLCDLHPSVKLLMVLSAGSLLQGYVTR